MVNHVKVMSRDELAEAPNAYQIQSKVFDQKRLNILLDDRIHKIQ
jgi:hypothetical protein